MLSAMANEVTGSMKGDRSFKRASSHSSHESHVDGDDGNDNITSSQNKDCSRQSTSEFHRPGHLSGYGQNRNIRTPPSSQRSSTSTLNYNENQRWVNGEAWFPAEVPFSLPDNPFEPRPLRPKLSTAPRQGGPEYPSSEEHVESRKYLPGEEEEAQFVRQSPLDPRNSLYFSSLLTYRSHVEKMAALLQNQGVLQPPRIDQAYPNYPAVHPSTLASPTTLATSSIIPDLLDWGAPTNMSQFAASTAPSPRPDYLSSTTVRPHPEISLASGKTSPKRPRPLPWPSGQIPTSLHNLVLPARKKPGPVWKDLRKQPEENSSSPRDSYSSTHRTDAKALPAREQDNLETPSSLHSLYSRFHDCMDQSDQSRNALISLGPADPILNVSMERTADSRRRLQSGSDESADEYVDADSNQRQR